MSSCCKSGFQWDGTPVGKETKLANLNTYVTGSNKDAAVLVIADIFGWTLTNIRLLADHYASEAGVTVYVPDLWVTPPRMFGDFERKRLTLNSFDGEVVTPETMEDPEKFKNFDIGAFMGRHGKDIRGPEIFACAKALKQELGFKKLGAIGFCYGGWAVFRLGAQGELTQRIFRETSTSLGIDSSC